MVDIDFAALDRAELQSIQKRVEKALADYDDRKRADAARQVDDLAKSLGFNLHDLANVTTKRKVSPSVAKYRNPADPDDTWSGRGRKPKWIAEALTAGKSLEDFAI